MAAQWLGTRQRIEQTTPCTFLGKVTAVPTQGLCLDQNDTKDSFGQLHCAPRPYFDLFS